MKKKILLLNTPFYRLMGSHYNGHSLGIGYIAACLNEHGHEAKLYNADYLNSEEYINQRGIFEGYASYKTIMNNPEHPIWEEIVTFIQNYGPDILGITSYTANIKSARIIAKKLKELDKGLKIVVGGDHPTLDPDGTIRYEKFDYLVRGEGEFALLELANGVNESKILGLSYKRRGEIIHNPDRPFIHDLDCLPFPDRDSILNSNSNLDVGQVITGRGCPYTCTYCISPKKWKKQVRFRSIKNIIAEIEYIKRNYGSALIYFVDDTFTLNKKRAKELMQQIIEKDIQIQWKCDTRADHIDRELAQLMKLSGCVRAKIGVESGSDRILKKIRKRETTEDIRRGITLSKEAGVPLTVYLMAGFPGETNEDLRQTIKFAKEIDAEYYSLSILAPFYGTQIFREFEDSGHKLDKEHWEYFYHQSGDMILNNNLDLEIINEFLALNERNGKGIWI